MCLMYMQTYVMSEYSSHPYHFKYFRPMIPYPESPSTQYSRTLVPKTIPLMAFGTSVLKYLVFGPSAIAMGLMGHAVFEAFTASSRSTLAEPLRSLDAVRRAQKDHPPWRAVLGAQTTILTEGSHRFGEPM